MEPQDKQPENVQQAVPPQDNKPQGRGGRGGGGGGERRGGRGRGPRTDYAEKEFDQEIIDLARVTRVMAGGKRMRFRACVAIGDKKGRVGVSVAKGADVTIAINKAVTKAKKTLLTVPLVNDTIPYGVHEKYGSAVILLKPAPRGTGVKAGGSMRAILVLAGVPNVIGKILGSKNKINNVRATMNAIKKLRIIEVKEKKKDDKSQPKVKAAKKEIKK